MPRLVEGAKWTYDWVVVGPEGAVTIPPEAWREFGFQAGGEVVFVPGSQRSGGFGIGTAGLMGTISEWLGGATLRVLARGRFGQDGRVTAPPEVGVKPGDRLLVVRGSRYGVEMDCLSPPGSP